MSGCNWIKSYGPNLSDNSFQLFNLGNWQLIYRDYFKKNQFVFYQNEITAGIYFGSYQQLGGCKNK